MLAQHGVEVHVWDVDGDPFVITTGIKYLKSFDFVGREHWVLNSNPHPNYVFSSDRHAQELVGAGIVNFSEEPKQGELGRWDPTSPSHY